MFSLLSSVRSPSLLSSVRRIVKIYILSPISRFTKNGDPVVRLVLIASCRTILKSPEESSTLVPHLVFVTILFVLSQLNVLNFRLVLLKVLRRLLNVSISG